MIFECRNKERDGLLYRVHVPVSALLYCLIFIFAGAVFSSRLLSKVHYLEFVIY
jgi:hypothetical protein